MPRTCKNQADNFCYICGKMTLKRCRRRLTPHVKKLYELYFGCKVGDQDKNWAPHACCVRCASSLSWCGVNPKIIVQIAISVLLTYQVAILRVRKL